MGNKELDANLMEKISREREIQLDKRIGKLSGIQKIMANEIKIAVSEYGCERGLYIGSVIREFNRNPKAKPSEWFGKKRKFLPIKLYGGLLDTYVPKQMQPSYLYLIDKLNQFPYTRGWYRRSVRTAGYGPHMWKAFVLLHAYEKLFYCGMELEKVILRKLEPEVLSYVRSVSYPFMEDFSYLYAAEIDLGNQAVIDALRELILSENNTAYLDREMILGILRSDHEELHQLICDLLLAARLQEGVRQVICEAMDEGTPKAFMRLLKTIETHHLIRFASVKRAVSTWVGIFDESSVDRISIKMLESMGLCLRDAGFCDEQLKTNDSIEIIIALWAKGFYEVQDALNAMVILIDSGTKNQKMTASIYLNLIQDTRYKNQMAQKVLMAYPDDLQLSACFFPAFSGRLEADMRGLFVEKKTMSGFGTMIEEPKKPELANYYQSREEAERLYDLFTNMKDRLSGKGVSYDPCIFPWYRVELTPTMVLQELAFLSFVLQDEKKITQTARLLGEAKMGAGVYYCGRGRLINLLLFEPKNREQRELLIGYMGNAEEDTSEKAFRMVSRLSLTEDEYRLLEDMLRYKRSFLRNHLLELLMQQNDSQMEASLKRLLGDPKEEKRTAGLDMLMQLGKQKRRVGCYANVRGQALLIKNPSDREKILIQEITEDREGNNEVQGGKGHGIYDSNVKVELKPVKADKEILTACIPISEREVISILSKLDHLIDQNKEFEYLTGSGEMVLLGDQYTALKKGSEDGSELGNYPLADALREFYVKEIKSSQVLRALDVRSTLDESFYRMGKTLYKGVFGKLPFDGITFSMRYQHQIVRILANYKKDFFDRSTLFAESVQVVSALTEIMSSKSFQYQSTSWNGSRYQREGYVNQLPWFRDYFEGLGHWKSEEEFRQAFSVAFRAEVKYRSHEEDGQFLNRGYKSLTPIRLIWFIKAYLIGVIPKDMIYKGMLEYLDGRDSLEELTTLVAGDWVKRRKSWILIRFFGENYSREIQEKGIRHMLDHTEEGRLCKELYNEVVPLMVDVELRRGDSETEFTKYMSGITYISGIDYLIRILMALGDDSYGTGFSSAGSKKDVLSRLLQACCPAAGETGENLRDQLKGTDITDGRLVKAAMYAPQWIDVVEACLGWHGLKSGCYYFMAHMDETFDDEKKSIIAKYTPISTEDLRAGAFDVQWFQDVYTQLGEKKFRQLYDGAKYISYGSKHVRARKYADAAVGKVTAEGLKQEISAKRNKDSLMSYGLVPFGEDGEADLLERYQYLQQFLKESRQFGAQRRASEAKAVEMALLNLSVRVGYSDVTRLTLKMETKMSEKFQTYMDWKQIEEYEVKLVVSEIGKSQILCRKGEKLLASIPSKLSKHAYVEEIKGVNKQLREQYSRTRNMMEAAMEHQTLFAVGEIVMLCANPVVRAIVKPLVYVADGVIGFFRESPGLCLESCEGTKITLSEAASVRIAHPLDFYRDQTWHNYQKYLFDRKMQQPFKQIYRELYVKLPEELGKNHSLMFAGNQIQPKKMAGCLKSRNWIADYDEGLQKIYYEQDLIARIYALADWFSPSEVEAPTLEWVEFSDRKTFKPLTIEQVPDLIYSEVMRDVDLAVSVAHAGGVDPETSHSTIDMRRMILTFNLPMFGLSNVSFTEHHAIIKGKRGEYHVHLGSGIVHQRGGAMLNILPVHSQSRGKLFLPFVDEDPKTAEIMSKIVLLAEDEKIKDPLILDQIV